MSVVAIAASDIFGDTTLGLMADPDSIDRELAGRSLSDFIRVFWEHIDPADYVGGWHIDAICEHLEAVTLGQIKRLLINIPPRHMKSIAVAVAWPAWTWAQRYQGRGKPHCGPRTQFLFASYAASLSIRDSVKCRRLIESPKYQRLFGDRFQLVGDQNTKTRYDNSRGGYRLATSVDGALTGEGGDIIAIDDPHNVREAESDTKRAAVIDWWREAMSTRLNDPKIGVYVVIMQRVHSKDLSGYILSDDEERRDWTHLCLPAEHEIGRMATTTIGWSDPRVKEGELLWPERFGAKEIDATKSALGSYGTAGQLQQRPAPREGGMFRRMWFEIVHAAPGDLIRVRFWDKAGTEARAGTDPDWTAGLLVGVHPSTKIAYVLDIRRMRGSPLDVQKLIKQTAETDGTDVPVYMEQEPGSSGKADVDHYRRNVLTGWAFRGISATGSKELRADPVSAQAEAGNVKLLKGEWNQTFLDEVSVFPNGAHDDQVDALSGAYGQAIRRLKPSTVENAFAGVGVF